MLTTLLVMLVFAVLFVAVGLLRTMDRGTGGCHGCSRGEGGECGPEQAECALLKDVFETKPTAEVAR